MWVCVWTCVVTMCENRNGRNGKRCGDEREKGGKGWWEEGGKGWWEEEGKGWWEEVEQTWSDIYRCDRSPCESWEKKRSKRDHRNGTVCLLAVTLVVICDDTVWWELCQCGDMWWHCVVKVWWELCEFSDMWWECDESCDSVVKVWRVLWQCGEYDNVVIYGNNVVKVWLELRQCDDMWWQCGECGDMWWHCDDST